MNTPRQTLITTLGITLLLATSAASADPRHEGGHNRFMEYFDTNGDTVVTYQEFLDASKHRFERIDTDHNASLTEAEFSAYMKTRREEHHKDRMARMDTDKDGKVSKDEFLTASQARAQRKFDRMDKDNDGVLSEAELAARKDHRPNFGKKVFSRIDADGDGKVTQEESQAAWGKWFARLDSNGDQVVTAEEMEQARARWQDR